MLKNLFLAAAMLAFGSFAAKADVVNFGAIRMDVNSPSIGLISFVVSNISGSGCDAFYNSCTPLFINNGLLQVNYLDNLNTAQVFSANLSNNFGPGETNPGTFNDFTVDPAGWTIQSVTFSGLLSPSSLFLFDGSTKVLTPLTFSATFRPDSFGVEETPYADLTATAVDAPAVPEPGSLMLTAAGSLLVLAGAVRRRRQRQQQG